MIKTINLTKKFGSLVAVDNLNLEIPGGEIFGFLGPNGAGKTTTVKLLTGLLKPDSGKMFINGYDLEKDILKVKETVGLLPEHPFLYPKLTGKEYLFFLVHLYQLDLLVNKRVLDLLEMFRLSDFSDELIETYSLGMRQKLILAGIILREPKVLLLDEPLVGLDPQTAKLVKEIFLKFAAQGKTVFLCTHILEIAEKLCHRIGIIQQGKLIALGTIEQLRRQAEVDGNLEDIFFRLTEKDNYPK
jgi:ABC-2 type transport system ATP-binding protein